MIAPRKKLWSTPIEVINKAIELLELDETDVVYDIGAGDGRFIITCAQNTNSKCVGVEIDSERASEINSKIQEAHIDESKCLVINQNALDLNYHDATAIFLYLVPRGLRIILPILQAIPRSTVKVVTFMNPFPNENDCGVVQSLKIHSSLHPESQWPVFFYHLPCGKIESINRPIPSLIDEESDV